MYSDINVSLETLVYGEVSGGKGRAIAEVADVRACATYLADALAKLVFGFTSSAAYQADLIKPATNLAIRVRQLLLTF